MDNDRMAFPVTSQRKYNSLKMAFVVSMCLFISGNEDIA